MLLLVPDGRVKIWIGAVEPDIILREMDRWIDIKHKIRFCIDGVIEHFH